MRREVVSTWLLQANPRVFKIDEYLRTRREIDWVVRRYKSEVAVGDEVFIWRADGGKPGSGGVVARGFITSGPELSKCDAPELWIKEPKAKIELRVKIKLEEVRLTPEEGMLMREELKRDDALRNMLIFRAPMQSIFKLSPEQAFRLRRLWDERKG